MFAYIYRREVNMFRMGAVVFPFTFSKSRLVKTLTKRKLYRTLQEVGL